MEPSSFNKKKKPTLAELALLTALSAAAPSSGYAQEEDSEGGSFRDIKDHAEAVNNIFPDEFKDHIEIGNIMINYLKEMNQDNFPESKLKMIITLPPKKP